MGSQLIFQRLRLSSPGQKYLLNEYILQINSRKGFGRCRLSCFFTLYTLSIYPSAHKQLSRHLPNPFRGFHSRCITCLLLAMMRICRVVQLAPISFNMESLQIFRTTRVVNLDTIISSQQNGYFLILILECKESLVRNVLNWIWIAKISQKRDKLFFILNIKTKKHILLNIFVKL